MNGKMFAFEGTEGCGKSTIIKHVEEKLKKKGYKTTVIREPGGTSIGEDIRKIIFNPSYKDIDKTTELLLMLAIRNENYQNSIKLSLSKGYIVLCDRYVDSTLVYQGYRYSYEKAIHIQEIIRILFGFLFPPELKKSFYLWLPNVEIGLQRIKDNNRNTNKFDEMDIQFHKTIKESYDMLYCGNDSLRIPIKADRNIEDIVEEIIRHIEDNITDEDKEYNYKKDNKYK